MTTARMNGVARAAAARCLSLGGRGSPAGATLEAAIEAVTAVAAEVRAVRRRAGHDVKLPAAEVRFVGPPAAGRGGATWRVMVRVPATITERDARTAAATAGERYPAARNVRLEVVAPVKGRKAPPGRDRMPGSIRKTRTGAVSQHRARELL